MNWNATCAARIAREVRGYPYKRSHLVALRADQDHGERSALDVVAGRAMSAAWSWTGEITRNIFIWRPSQRWHDELRRTLVLRRQKARYVLGE